MDPIIELLQASDLGCHIHVAYVGCLMLMTLYSLSASVGNLQKMLDLCYTASFELDILFNAKKSSVFIVGKNCSMLVDRLKLGNDNVTWSDHLKYLGIMFKSGKRLQSDLDLCVRIDFTLL